MSKSTGTMNGGVTRGRFQGLRQVVFFNWPMYVVAAVAGGGAILALVFLPMPEWLRVLVAAATGIGLFWTVGSLVVSYWVYDASPLCKWRWVADTLPGRPDRWLNLHCGFDESTPALLALFRGTHGEALDIFDPAHMTEPSIMRARGLTAPADRANSADYRQLPVADDSIDAAFLMLSAHELRSPDARAALFAELRRIVRAKGRVVVAEHLRDTENFIAFGPGFVHFHSRGAWLRTFLDSGFAIERELRMTPFVAVFVLRRAA